MGVKMKYNVILPRNEMRGEITKVILPKSFYKSKKFKPIIKDTISDFFIPVFLFIQLCSFFFSLFNYAVDFSFTTKTFCHQFKIWAQSYQQKIWALELFFRKLSKWVVILLVYQDQLVWENWSLVWENWSLVWENWSYQLHHHHQ